MTGYRRITVSGGPPTRLGRLLLAGEVNEAEPVMPKKLRVLDAFVISVVTAGHGRFRASGTPPAAITPCTITVVTPGVPHWYGTPPGEHWSEWYAVVEGPLFAMLQSAGVITHSGPVRIPPGPSTHALGLALSRQPSSPLAAEHQLFALADWVTTALRPARPDEDRWSRATDALTRNLAMKVDLQALADELGMTYDKFRHEFARVTGLAPLAYRNVRRVETAATLLRITALPLREIAQELGFTDEFHFSRAFRRHFGQPPGYYRRDHEQS